MQSCIFSLALGISKISQIKKIPWISRIVSFSWFYSISLSSGLASVESSSLFWGSEQVSKLGLRLDPLIRSESEVFLGWKWSGLSSGSSSESGNRLKVSGSSEPRSLSPNFQTLQKGGGQLGSGALRLFYDRQIYYYLTYPGQAHFSLLRNMCYLGLFCLQAAQPHHPFFQGESAVLNVCK